MKSPNMNNSGRLTAKELEERLRHGGTPLTREEFEKRIREIVDRKGKPGGTTQQG